MSITEETRRDSFYATNTVATKKDVMSALNSENKTAREVAQATKKALNDVRSRLTELKQLGKVEVCGKKKDDISKRMVAIFKVVG